MESNDAVHSHGYQSDGITHFDEHSATAAAISSCLVGQYSAHCGHLIHDNAVGFALGRSHYATLWQGLFRQNAIGLFGTIQHFLGLFEHHRDVDYSKNKMWQAFVINLFWAIVLLVSAYWLVERGLNATGIALAVLIAYSLKSILATLYLTLFLKR